MFYTSIRHLVVGIATCWVTVLPSHAASCHMTRIEQDLPDPDTLLANGMYFVYSTNSDLGNVPIMQSDNLSDFQHVGDALPELPAWARPHYTWAPEVAFFAATNSYALYFTARYGAMQCIGVATAGTPIGPFAPAEDPPLVCPTAEGGAIDASTFADVDGRIYLLWKNDGNCCGIDTWISIQELSADGQQLVGSSTKLLRQDQPWEGKVVEAPTLWLQDGKYFLFYSANTYDDNYGIGYAAADELLGPFIKSEQPLLATSKRPEGAIGPGGQDIVRKADGSTLIIYHSWSEDMSYRGLNVNELAWENANPRVVTGCAID
jgi:arabinan endo-1,5-alpha-L-arabinosidase